MPIFQVNLSDKLAQAVQKLASLQDPPVTPAFYVENIIRHVVRGQIAQTESEESKLVLDAYTNADSAIKAQVEQLLGL